MRIWMVPRNTAGEYDLSCLRIEWFMAVASVVIAKVLEIKLAGTGFTLALSQYSVVGWLEQRQ